MANLIFPQEISFTESYPGGASIKIYGIIPAAEDGYFVNLDGYTGRWYTNTVSTYNYVNNLDTPFGHVLPDHGEDFVVHFVNDHDTDTVIYPDDLNANGNLTTSVLCQEFSPYCSSDELSEYSNIYNYHLKNYCSVFFATLIISFYFLYHFSNKCHIYL